MTHRNAAIQKRARALLAGLESGDRMQVYERLRGTVSSRTASASSGKRVFSRALRDLSRDRRRRADRWART